MSIGRFACGCWGLCLLLLLSWITDQSVQSSYQTRTSLAWLHDCHSRYDERSIDQKKKLESDTAVHVSLYILLMVEITNHAIKSEKKCFFFSGKKVPLFTNFLMSREKYYTLLFFSI